ncbi:MAG: NAD(P)-binding protein [Desulfobacteraceae bacterium]|nr:NAD(P)-binding protein [Desulfobacteraceae bacterium]
MKETDPSKTIRVAVIGGGPSGWSAAETLRDMDDAFDVTVYERNDYFGGKCCTVLEDGTIANGRPGGYEMGAGVLTPGSRVYKDTMKLIDKGNLKINKALPPGLKAINYFRDGDDAWHETHPVSFYNMIHHPGRFLRGLYGYVKLGIDMLRFQRYRVDMANSPGQLAQTMSERYPVELNSILSVFMQGYGYAHESDPRLTPPMLYYHQYMQPDMLGREKINIDKGMRKRLYKLETGLKDGFNARMIERSFAKIFHWDDYFGHLESEDILDDWYDTFNKTIQGKSNTLFVSSGLHMEIIGSSVQYSKHAVEKFAGEWLAAS